VACSKISHSLWRDLVGPQRGSKSGGRVSDIARNVNSLNDYTVNKPLKSRSIAITRCSSVVLIVFALAFSPTRSVSKIGIVASLRRQPPMSVYVSNICFLDLRSIDAICSDNRSFFLSRELWGIRIATEQ
jgi:hypothetical protein